MSQGESRSVGGVGNRALMWLTSLVHAELNKHIGNTDCLAWPAMIHIVPCPCMHL